MEKLQIQKMATEQTNMTEAIVKAVDEAASMAVQAMARTQTENR